MINDAQKCEELKYTIIKNIRGDNNQLIWLTFRLF